MTRTAGWRALIAGACVAFAIVCGNARADDVPLITGEHWVKSTTELKKAYLIGMANIIQVEHAYHVSNPPSDQQSILPRLERGLKGETVNSVLLAVDKWYAAHPDRLQQPVFETIWFEVVVPDLNKAD